MSQESADHFNSVASDYDKYRTTDLEPINWLVKALPRRVHSVCDLGCGTARYGFALAARLKESGYPVQRLVGVDTSQEMLREAAAQSSDYEFECDWMGATSGQTGIDSHSISLSISFNSIHYLPLVETFSEVYRICETGGHFGVYTRLREQEEEHVWGRWFPGYIDYSLVPPRATMNNASDLDPRFILEGTYEFRFPREATFSWICEQTRNKFYSTFDRYSQEDFDRAYVEFIDNLKTNYTDIDRIRYWSSYSIWLYRTAGAKGDRDQ